MSGYRTLRAAASIGALAMMTTGVGAQDAGSSFQFIKSPRQLCTRVEVPENRCR
jgi:hypothetical protein